MTSNKFACSTTLALLFSASVVAEEVPVIELGVGSGQNSSNTAPYIPQASSGSELMLIVQQLQDEVRVLRGQVEQQDYRLKQMESKQLDRYRDLDRRISAAAQSSASKGSMAPVAGEIAVSQSVADNQNKVSQRSLAPSKPVLDDAKAYQSAYNLVKKDRNIPQAVKAFNAFIKDYPNSPRLPNAHYWLGEIHLLEKNLDQANASFTEVLTGFPKSHKAPDAAYKLGIIYDQLGDRKKSDEYLNLVINKYPGSSAVRLAKEFKLR